MKYREYIFYEVSLNSMHGISNEEPRGDVEIFAVDKNLNYKLGLTPVNASSTSRHLVSALSELLNYVNNRKYYKDIRVK